MSESGQDIEEMDTNQSISGRMWLFFAIEVTFVSTVFVYEVLDTIFNLNRMNGLLEAPVYVQEIVISLGAIWGFIGLLLLILRLKSSAEEPFLFLTNFSTISFLLIFLLWGSFVIWILSNFIIYIVSVIALWLLTIYTMSNIKERYKSEKKRRTHS